MADVVVTLRTLATSVDAGLPVLSKNTLVRSIYPDTPISGGYLRIEAKDAPGDGLVSLPIRDVDDLQVAAYARSAAQLAHRLRELPSHDLLFEVPDFMLQENGNALRLRPFILSFVGIPGELAAVLLLMGVVNAKVLASEIARQHIYHFVRRPYEHQHELWNL